MRMATSGAPPAGSDTVRQWLAETLPKIVLAPTLVASLIFVYGFIAWTGYLSLTPSRLLPNYDFVGLAQYIALFDNERWWVALKNLGIFGFLFVFLRTIGPRGDPAGPAHPHRRVSALATTSNGSVLHRRARRGSGY